MANSIFRYPGGKSRKSVREKILARAPKGFKEYREPFIGGGGIFFAIDPKIPRWIGDKDDDLMSVYQILKYRSAYFLNMCRAIKPAQEGEELVPAKPDSTHKRSKSKALYNARLKACFDLFAQDKGFDIDSKTEMPIPNGEKANPALRYFFVNRTVWAGRVNYDLSSRMYFSNPSGWNIVNGDKLEKAAELLCWTTLLYGGYNNILELPGNDVWIYCDPPYDKNTDLSSSSKLYKHNFTKEDHAELADKVKSSPHNILLSYDDDDNGFIRSLYKDFNIYEESWTYCGTSSSDDAVTKTKRQGKELLICNY